MSLELDARHTKVAAGNIDRAGLSGAVEIIVGPAIESLRTLVTRNGPGYDFIFIDADKESTTEYFDLSLQLSHAGSLIVVDNVVRGGRIAHEANGDTSVQGMQRFLDALASERRVSTTAIQTVGSKGHDGFVLALVTNGAG